MAASGVPLHSSPIPASLIPEPSPPPFSPHPRLLKSVGNARPAPAASRPFSMAFQPIVDLEDTRIIAYEALVRGLGNQPAATILSAPHTGGRASIDRACRLTAIEVACSLGVLATGADLAINVNARPASNNIPSLPATIAAADRAGLPLDRLILEITEEERIRNPAQLQRTVQHLRERGLRIAIDDFGAGFAGLTLLAAFHPDILKIDIALTRDIHQRHTSRVIIRSVLQICRDLDIQLIAEGIETSDQKHALEDLGVRYMQGHYFAEPAFEALPIWPAA